MLHNIQPRLEELLVSWQRSINKMLWGEVVSYCTDNTQCVTQDAMPRGKICMVVQLQPIGHSLLLQYVDPMHVSVLPWQASQP